MGFVYEAIDLRLGRSVAIKLMRPERSNDERFRQRFLREAKAVAALHSDHIIQLHHIGDHSSADGSHMLYLVMPLLRGQNLEDRLKHGGPLSLAELVQLVREAALGLATAHQANIIHRDIKPANIWLETLPHPATSGARSPHYPSGWRVKLLDFGLARNLVDDETVTQSGVIVGTPAYMAPEQRIDGRADSRTDVFSLGVVLFECATGQRPYYDVLRLLGEPIPDPRERRPDLPEPLAVLIMHMLRLKPEDRPPDGHAVLAAIQAYEQATTRAIDRVGLSQVDLETVSGVRPLPGVVPPPSPPPAPAAAVSPSPATPTPTPTPNWGVVTPAPTKHLAAGSDVLSPPSPPPTPRAGWKWRWLKRLVGLVLLAGLATFAVYAGQYLPRRFHIDWLWKTRERIANEWQAETEEVLQSLALSPDGQWLAVLNSQGYVTIWDAATATVRLTLPKRVTEPRLLCFSSDGKYVIGAGGVRSKGQIVVQPADGTGEPTIVEPASAVLQLCSLASGDIVVGTISGDISGYHPTTGQATFALPRQNQAITALAVSPDGKQLAFAANDRTINHWNLHTKRPIRTIKGHAKAVTALAFNSDGTLLASGSLDRTVRVWKTDSGSNLYTFRASRHTIRALRFSSNGFYLYSADGDLDRASDLVIWDLIRGRLVQTLYGHLDLIQNFDLTPDNRSAYSGSHDGWIIRWRLGDDPLPTR
jgi:serine/threonine protein kinase